jgi:hypothetical protein
MKRFISRIPEFGDSSEDVKILKAALNEKTGSHLDLENDYFGENTKTTVSKFQKNIGLPGSGNIGFETLAALELEITPNSAAHAINPAYEKAKKYIGQKETDKKLQDKLIPYWKRVGLKGYKTLVGSSFAWCALFIVAMNTESGLSTINSASAKSFSRYGVEIDWKKDGIPRGAVVHINHKANCNSGSNNHVAFSDGDCTAGDVSKPGSQINFYGGNQNNSVRVSTFPAGDICEVRWPTEIPKPGKIMKSDGCIGKASSGQTTR